MVAVPAPTPLTMPEEEPTVARNVLLLAQVPPVVASVSVVADPGQIVVVPLIAPGKGLMVTVALPSAPQQPADDSALK